MVSKSEWELRLPRWREASRRPRRRQRFPWTLHDFPASAPSTRVFNRIIWKWSRSPAEGFGSLTGRALQRHQIAALIIPGMSRRSAIPTCSRIGRLSTCRTRDCAYWPPRSRRPICASAAPGPIAPTLRKTMKCPPRRPTASARCSAANAGKLSSTLPTPPAQRS